MQRLINQRAKLFLVIFIIAINRPSVLHTKKNGSYLQLIANMIRLLDLRQSFFPSLLLQKLSEFDVFIDFRQCKKCILDRNAGCFKFRVII